MPARNTRKARSACLAAAFAVSAIGLPGHAWAEHKARPSLFSPAIKEQLDQSLTDLTRTGNVPSVAVEVAVPHKGKYTFVTGTADLADGSARNLRQPFRIASLTKTFAATAVLQLVDRGKLAKTDVISKWYPDFPNADKITVDDLLRMRSGIAAPSDEETIDAIFDHPTMKAPSLAEMMAQSAAMKDKFIPPDQEGVYTNLNYFILGGIVQQITGHDIGRYIERHIIRRLGLKHTTYPTGDDLPGGLRGYALDPQSQQFLDKTAFNPALAGAAGAMISNLDDLTRYAHVLCAGGLLKSETQQARLQGKPLQGTTTEYGEGVIAGPGGLCGHAGTVPGFNTDLYHLKALDVTVVVSVNRLDRDDQQQTGPFTAAVFEALKSQFGALTE
jgi:D-alanyl-D-alanine carboxypeptidase